MKPVLLEKIDARTAEVVGMVMKRCNARHYSDCFSCASLWHGDSYRMGRDGLRHEGMTYVKVTLTLPAFGRVHYRDAGSSKRCHCSKIHAAGDAILGTPISTHLFDYERLVRANATLGKLWTRSMALLTKIISSQQTDGTVPPVSWFGVPEPHLSGAMHVHAVLRLDLARERLGIYTDGQRVRSGLVEDFFAGFRSNTTIGGLPFEMAWGSNVMAEVATQLDEDVSISYLLKTTGTRQPMQLSYKGGARGLHIAHAQDAAFRLIALQQQHCEISPSVAAKRYRKTSAGWVGDSILKSRNWTTLTFTSLRKERAVYGSKKSATVHANTDIQWRFAGRRVLPMVPPEAAHNVLTPSENQPVPAQGISVPTQVPAEQVAGQLRTRTPWICIDTFHPLDHGNQFPIAVDLPLWVKQHGSSIGVGDG
ncbi:hypothetical protein ABIB27_000180 [Arthrobacter sp. UYEF21]